MLLQSIRNFKRKYQGEKNPWLHLFPSSWKLKWHVTTFNKIFVMQRQYRNIMKGNKLPNLHANSLNAAEKYYIFHIFLTAKTELVPGNSMHFDQ